MNAHEKANRSERVRRGALDRGPAAGGGERVALLVTVRWGDDVIASRRLSGAAEAAVGAAPGAIAAIPCASLGREAFVLARVRRGRAAACVPAGCVAAWRRGEPEDGQGAVPRLIAGPAEIPLVAGEEVTLWIAGFQLAVAAAADDRPPWAIAPWQARSRSALPHVALAALVHAIAAGVAAEAALAANLEEDRAEAADVLRGYLAAAERRAQAPDPAIHADVGRGEGREMNGHSGNGKAGGGERAAGDEGAMGSRLSREQRARRYALPSPDARGAALAETGGLADAREFGMIGLLAAEREHAPRADFGEIAARGLDSIAADGAMWGRALGERAGSEALGLTGIGLGGGGSGLGVGLDRIGTIGHTHGPPGTGTGGDGDPAHGFGISGWSSWCGCHGLIGRGWGTLRTHGYGGSSINAPRIPPEVIQRIVRQNHGRFRGCYERGLAANPALAGRVTTRFLIGEDGAVASAADAGSDLPDAQVVSCVVRAFYGLSFPASPGGGPVTVSYPLAFAPTE